MLTQLTQALPTSSDPKLIAGLIGLALVIGATLAISGAYGLGLRGKETIPNPAMKWARRRPVIALSIGVVLVLASVVAGLATGVSNAEPPLTKTLSHSTLH